MSKVDKLIAKALSTSSEDEAIAALRFARKQHNGEYASKVEDTVSKKSYNELREQALKLQKLAQKYKEDSIHNNRQAMYYFERFNNVSVQLSELKLKNISQRQRNYKPTNWVMIGFLIGSFIGVAVGSFM